MKVVKLTTPEGVVSTARDADNYIFVSTNNDGEKASYSYRISEDSTWKVWAMLFGYIELVKDEIKYGGESDDGRT